MFCFILFITKIFGFTIISQLPTFTITIFKCCSFFSTPMLIRHLWHLKTIVFLHWCKIPAVLLFSNFNVTSVHCSHGNSCPPPKRNYKTSSDFKIARVNTPLIEFFLRFPLQTIVFICRNQLETFFFLFKPKKIL